MMNRLAGALLLAIAVVAACQFAPRTRCQFQPYSYCDDSAAGDGG